MLKFMVRWGLWLGVFLYAATHATSAMAKSGWCQPFGGLPTYEDAMKQCFNVMLPESPYIIMGSCVPLNYGEFNGVPNAISGAWVISEVRNPGNGQIYINDGVGNQWWCYLTPITPNAAKGNGQPKKCNCVADPINAGNGNAYRREEDFSAGRWLKFVRHYNSDPSAGEGTLGQHWQHNYNETLRYQSATGSNPASVTVNREDGQIISFVSTNGNWVGEMDVVDELTEQVDGSGRPTGWTLQRVDTRSTEQFDGSGNLISSKDAEDFLTSFTYSDSTTPTSVAPGIGYLIKVTDPQQRSIAFFYDGNGRINKVLAPDGSPYIYDYTTDGDLESVTFPDGKAVTYFYNESPNSGGATTSGLLTGISDETGTRYISYSYNAAGQATNNQLAGGVANYTLTYHSDGSADVMDPLGTVRHHTFTTIQGVPYGTSVDGICASCSSIAKWSYTFNGQLSQTTDFNGNVTTYQEDGDGMPAGRVEGLGSATPRMIQTSWDDVFHVPTEHRIYSSGYSLVRKTDWLYNARGQALAQCDIDMAVSGASSYVCSATGTPPAGVRRSTSTYCDSVGTGCPLIGLLLTTTGPRTDVTQTTSFAYAPNGDLHQVTAPLGHTTTYDSYDGAGRLTQMTDANGVVTSYTYYPRGWLHTRTVAGATTTITYTPYGSVASITDPDNIATSFSYDDAHRLTDITDAQANVIHYTLDAAGNKTAEQIRNASGTVVHSLSRTFNALGQLTAVVDGLNHTVFNAGYTDSYDANGNLVHSADGLGVQRQQNFDALNRLQSTIDNYNGTDTATKNTATALSLDALDRVDGVADPSGLNTLSTYDAFGDRKQLQSPDTGTSSASFDAAGNRLTSTDANGVVATSTYDALNRRTGTSYVDSTLNVTYAYDEANASTGCSNSAPIGRLTRVIEHAVTTVFCYDSRGNILQKKQITSANTDVTQYTYTSADRLSSVTQPDLTAVSYSYDSDGRVSGVTVTPAGSSSASPTVVSAITWMPFGPIASYTLGNGQVITRSYDANYQLSDLTSTALNLHFARDTMGNITALGNAAGASPASETYAYDPLYRLNSVTEAGGSTLESYTYNPTGDRLSKTSSGLGSGTYTYTTGTHQLASIGTDTRANDPAGNTTGSVIGGETYGFGYNGRNRMALAQRNGDTVGNYSYNAFGQRVGKASTFPTAGTERFTYDEAGHLTGEYGSTNRDYLWLGDLPIAIVDNTTSGGTTTSTVNYITGDQLGTPRAVTDGSGAVVWSWAYQGNPFGQQQPTSSAGYVLNLRYPGQYYDAETGLMYNGARYYEPGTGRFPQSDPMGLFGGQISTYAYGNNDPLSNIDPLGLDCSVSGGSVTCAYPGGGPTFRLPAPSNFPASLGSNDFWYHAYDITRSIGCADPNDVMQGLINNPTPALGNPRPATPGGTPNNAAVAYIAPNNPVTSYLTNDLNTGAPVVVNITGPGSIFGPGYVARTVTDGVAHTYGEGDAWTQSPLGGGIFPNWAVNQYVWGGQMNQIIANSRQRCGCTN